MSIITAIFQAIFQAITYIFPVSQSGHAAIFHDFAGRADGTVTMLTGAVNIGIATGVLAATFKFFARLATEFFGTGKALIKKEFDYNAATPTRKLMLMTLISFCPLILWVIPVGKNGLLYSVLSATAYNNTLFDEGIFLAVTGGLLFLSARLSDGEESAKLVNIPIAAAVGLCAMVFVPVSGLALIGGVFSVMLLLGISQKLALKYAYVLSVPILLVTGIVQLCTADYKSPIAAIIIGLVLAAVVSFGSVRVLSGVIKQGYIKYISYYDFSLAFIVVIIGIVQLIVRK